MGFVAYGEPADVTLAVVAYGMTDRLLACLGSLLAHESDASFTVVCVVNPDHREGDTDVSAIPGGVHVLQPEANLGWAGGLHLARRATTAQWMGWIQDDSELRPGWLNAQLRAASTRPRGGAFGALAIDDAGKPAGQSGGTAVPGMVATDWNSTDPNRGGSVPIETERRDWVTSKGMLVRLEAWDDVGGTCGRYFPLNRVDKEFTTHLRAHGWEVYLVHDAHLMHLQSQSAPGLLRQYIPTWQDAPFLALWDDAIRRMAAHEGAVEHDCHGHPDMATIERETLREASRMLVPFSKFAAAKLADERDRAQEHASQQAQYLANMEQTLSWRVTAPLRWVRRLVGGRG